MGDDGGRGIKNHLLGPKNKNKTPFLWEAAGSGFSLCGSAEKKKDLQKANSSCLNGSPRHTINCLINFHFIG